eukprot:CAMPEP_0185839888 /NCGR_PEP_ID=MMETSP1353-20130828/15352_1 /TAXON_ID=1077150 /ORGANISM="Erythrolobus australicus, Strain CCMP3124" /LENGTH=48 /DNA_ID= /DNA_START= /DNA_END= /DNA_ORIENTATION=
MPTWARFSYLERELADRVMVALDERVIVGFPRRIEFGCRFEIDAAWYP